MKLLIKEYMQKKGVTNVALAEKLGVTRVAVSLIVNGKAMPSLERLEQIAAALGVQVVDLIQSKETASQAAAVPSITCPSCGASIPLDINVKQDK